MLLRILIRLDKLVAFVLNVIVVLLATVWVLFAPDFEPVIAALTTIGAFFGAQYLGDKIRHVVYEPQPEEKPLDPFAGFEIKVWKNHKQEE